MIPSHRTVRVGVLSDTHGTLTEAAQAALAGVDAIIHAGDVGSGTVLDLLRTMAPVTAVRGNCDGAGEAATLRTVENVSIGGVRFLITHIGGDPRRRLDPLPGGVRVVVNGHSHRRRLEDVDGVLHLNPGSASHGRGDGRSVAVVSIDPDGTIAVEFADLP